MNALPRRHASRSAPPGRGTWLALFAMMMIFIGPLISQSMPMEHHTGMRLPAAHHASASMAHAPGGHHSLQAEPATAAHAAPMDHALWAKCGYCTLLFGCPALPQMLTLLAATPPKPSEFYAALTREGHARRTVFLHAQSRAPPFRQLS
ncbi:DUF2946 domain-containing protein [Pseudomonas sp. DTU_2021_1001937_2_SI_NGA_ILE_001]|uniref:DUF2946 domain-containing protein n=1 Tax=Pseudomonas sp. DTU_2021_1001937_2_SI_NGA_ILE_001 TaxID=3077589 RepID=UPI0028FC1F88|nr:DUF2946 domain-containing protein [Pseudomonas sp. DTU_2021_1001937_2_SI_NGA_ILE_001]WNW13165.1 DUF2946 domain-containing protein [Pseudomonas sp. DTU_2021_1001937_2_SI_NGA_ILE_001]